MTIALDVFGLVAGLVGGLVFLLTTIWKVSSWKKESEERCGKSEERLQYLAEKISRIGRREDERWAELAKKEHENRILHLEKTNEKIERLIEKQAEREEEHKEEMGKFALALTRISENVKYLKDRFDEVRR